MKKDQTCSTCRFWKSEPLQKHQGSCRVNPPMPVPMGGNGQIVTAGVWPPAQDEDFCGKHEPESVTIQ